MIYKQLIIRFFEGEISPEEKEILFQWLNEDIVNVQTFLRERKNYDLELVSNEQLTTPIDIKKEYEKIRKFIETDKRNQIKQKKLKRRSEGIRYLKQTISYAAILACCFFIGKQIIFKNQKEIVPKETNSIIPAQIQSHVIPAPEEYKVIQVFKGTKKMLLLPDNTKVWVNSQSELRFPEKFEGNTREVWLEGEAYFQVAKDANKQFIVHTREFDIKVHGTSFNVFAYKQYSEKAFTLVEGSITLTSNMNTNSKELYLIPGQQAIYDDGELNIKEIDPKTEISWKDNKFYFREKTFQDICRQLEHTFNVTIHIEGDNLKNYIYTGDFIRNESLADILSIMSSDKRMEYEINGNIIIIKEK